jgi:hypothetical protein
MPSAHGKQQKEIKNREANELEAANFKTNLYGSLKVLFFPSTSGRLSLPSLLAKRGTATHGTAQGQSSDFVHDV